MHTLLIIEEISALAQLYREELEEEGYEVIITHTGAAALAALETKRPSLVIADFHLYPFLCNTVLGGIAGQERTPVIMHTDFEHGSLEMLKTGALHLVLKSCDLEPLKSMIREVLTNSSPQPDNDTARAAA